MLPLYSAPVRPPLECCVHKCSFLCALQHKEEMELLKRAQQWVTKVIEGLSCDTWDCSAQRMP